VSRLARRVALAVGLLLAVSALTFGAMNVLGDPLFNILGPAAEDTTPAGIARIESAREEYHLDDPLPIRYVRWLGDFAAGDMGVQFSSDGQPPVSDLVAERLPRTAMLLVLAQLIATVVSIPWALLAAPRIDSWFDRLSTVSTFLVVALPNFALGVILKYVFAIRLGWFPQTYVAGDPPLAQLHQLLLPALTIALPAAAVYQRLLRDDLVSTLQEEYILMARSKGLARRSILFRHALRPSLFSFVTVFGLTTGALIGGSLVVENIFRVPGLGSAVVDAVVREDFPVVLAIVMVVAVVFVAVNFVVDAVYAVIDPRVRR
jgi:peptide/nickel transport system permease protein